jgi:hypothetical protein
MEEIQGTRTKHPVKEKALFLTGACGYAPFTTGGCISPG